jgi:gamma-glutamyl-gamma-aminobutyrate hydrolase PuuD
MKIYFSKNNKPVIGIYGNSHPENDDEAFLNGTYYPLSYVYWLESMGAEVMAIHYWYPYNVIDEILHKVNGILFLGGSRNILKNGTWELKARYIMEQSLINQLPIWGTCQGFQLIGVLM